MQQSTLGLNMLGGLLPMTPNMGGVSNAPSAVPNAALLPSHLPSSSSLHHASSSMSAGLLPSHQLDISSSRNKDSMAPGSISEMSGLLLAKATNSKSFHENHRHHHESKRSYQNISKHYRESNTRSYQEMHEDDRAHSNTRYDPYGLSSKKYSSSSSESLGNSTGSKVASPSSCGLGASLVMLLLLPKTLIYCTSNTYFFVTKIPFVYYYLLLCSSSFKC